MRQTTKIFFANHASNTSFQPTVSTNRQRDRESYKGCRINRKCRHKLRDEKNHYSVKLRIMLVIEFKVCLLWEMAKFMTFCFVLSSVLPLNSKQRKTSYQLIVSNGNRQYSWDQIFLILITVTSTCSSCHELQKKKRRNDVSKSSCLSLILRNENNTRYFQQLPDSKFCKFRKTKQNETVKSHCDHWPLV